MGFSLAGVGCRRAVKHALALPHRVGGRPADSGTTILIYHRVGGGTPDERDLGRDAFEAQVEELASHRVVSLDAALDELDAGDDGPKVVITFDDGFADVHEVAFPLLHAAGLPFTLYVTTAYVDGVMHWPGSTSAHPGPALTWGQLEVLAASPLVTIGNHTHTHARPEALTIEELDTCSETLTRRLGVEPRHFCFTWGVAVPSMQGALASRFRTAATGVAGRNRPDTDRLALRRVPVRGSDPLPFFQAKLGRSLGPEVAYERIVQMAKRASVGA